MSSTTASRIERALANRSAYSTGCRRCGARVVYPGAIFCGAACTAMYEAGDRPGTVRGDTQDSVTSTKREA